MISDIINAIIYLQDNLLLLDRAECVIEKELYIQKILFLCHTGKAIDQ